MHLLGMAQKKPEAAKLSEYGDENRGTDKDGKMLLLGW